MLTNAIDTQLAQARKNNDGKLYWLSLGELVGATDGTFRTIRNTPIPPELRSAMLPALPLLDRAHAYAIKFSKDAGASDAPGAIRDLKAIGAIAPKLVVHFAAAGLTTCTS